MNSFTKPFTLVLVAFSAITPAIANVRLHGLFTDHVVLQREKPIPVYGWADPGEEIIVTFMGTTARAKALKTGAWSVQLPTQKKTSSPQTLIVKGKNEIKIEDVLVGDVWLCSGQSNMAFGLDGCDAPEDKTSANYPMIRFLNYWECFASEPQENIVGTSWHPMEPGSVGGCSAVAFYFARKVWKETGVPIGLMVSTVGGTEIECWMPKEAFLNYPANAPIYKILVDAIDRYQKGLPASIDAIELWTKQAKEALTARKSVPEPPKFPRHPNVDRDNWVRIQSLYNGMIHPLIGFPIKGALWYQGESNGTEGDSYIEKQRAMVETWRKLWGYDFPFYYVQLANWLQPNDDPSGGDRSWQYIRMAQLEFLKIPLTGMAVIVDVGDAADIHPKNKQDVGERLARWALAKNYGKSDLVYSGPLYKNSTIEGSKIRVTFDQVGKGLMVGLKKGRAPAQPVPNGILKRFAIAGEDKVWHWAEAKVEGSSVIVWSKEVAKPIAVRYAFSINPEGCNLYNKEGLPASPFRTDRW